MLLLYYTYIEKLKWASNHQETQSVANLELPTQIHQTSLSFFETINNYPNKLRTNISIPANFNKHIENQQINCQYLVQTIVTFNLHLKFSWIQTLSIKNNVINNLTEFSKWSQRK